MIQIDTEDIESVLGWESEDGDQTDLLHFEDLSSDSEILSSVFDPEPITEASGTNPATSDSSQANPDSVISSVAGLLSENSVSYLVKESLRSKVSSRASVSSTTSSEATTEFCVDDQGLTEEDLQRQAKRRKLNREWAKKDRDRRRTRESHLQQKIEKLESENEELEKEIAELRDEARELRACWHLHTVFYH